MRNRQVQIVILCLLTLIYACERDREFDHDHLVDYVLLRTYTPSNIINTMEALQSIYPGISELADNIEYGIRVYSISYKSSFQGKEILATGLLSIPDVAGSFPVISYQNGTNTCHSNAPSANHNNLLYSLLNMNSGAGFIILMPDYVGFGGSDEYLHPYYDTESSNHVIRDMILAAGEFTDYTEGIEVNGELFLMGYSQGGWASLAALKDMENYPPGDYRLQAASCGAGAYDLIDFTHYLLELETYPNPFYLPYYIESRRQNGVIDDPLDSFFKEPYASAIPSLFDGSLCNAEINSQLTTDLYELLTEDLINGFDTNDDFTALRSELLSSSITPWKVNTPVLLTHSNGDQSVPIEQSLNIYEGLLTAGTDESNIDFTELDGMLHNEAIIPWGINTLTWFIDR
ncbi:MAG: alpha/beta hydrolase family protein [Bacteroidota bacterium]